MGSRSNPEVVDEHDLPAVTPPELSRKRRNAFSYVALLPAAVLVLGLMVLPIGETIYHSFTNWDGVTSTFIGFRNFELIFHNPIISQVLVNSLIFVISVPLILAASLVTAVLVYEKVLGWRVFRFLFFIPMVLSPVIVGVLFSTFFLPGGAVDQILRPLGLGNFSWLGNPWAARWVVILALVWASFGFGMVVILSAMTTVDTALYDAAAIDGASWWRRLRSITIPMISGSLQFLSVINVIYTFTSLFAFVFVITAGGPGFATTTVDYYTYITTFENGQFGYGAAIALLLFLIVLTLTIAQVKLFPNREVQQGS
ncbi:MAG TPA: sugar ABC transporter permease [Acidimicrobiales bacterium]|nr:sugar ABC transporter permease [Acidimicrobiales bacterium]